MGGISARISASKGGGHFLLDRRARQRLRAGDRQAAYGGDIPLQRDGRDARGARREGASDSGGVRHARAAHRARKPGRRAAGVRLRRVLEPSARDKFRPARAVEADTVRVRRAEPPSPRGLSRHRGHALHLRRLKRAPRSGGKDIAG